MATDERSKWSHSAIKDAIQMLAGALNRIEATRDKLEFLFEQNPEWDSGVKYQVEEAAANLGFALATLNTWWDDPTEQGEQ